MSAFDYPEIARFCMKAKPLFNIKRGALALLLAGLSGAAFAAEPSPSPWPAQSPDPAEREVEGDGRELPKIEIRDFDVRVLKRSESKSVYLFDDPSAALPAPGKILLLKSGDSELVMGLRVLKVYHELKQFAAKRVRSYHNHDALEPETSFKALEKLAEAPPPPPTEQDKAALKEFEEDQNAAEEDENANIAQGPPMPPPIQYQGNGPTPPMDSTAKQAQGGAQIIPAEAKSLKGYDPELDIESSPPPIGAVDSENAKFTPFGLDDDGSGTGLPGLEVDEVAPIEVNLHSVSGCYGMLRNRQVEDTPLYKAGGFRVSTMLKRMLFVRKPRFQDSLAIELGAFLYQGVYTTGTFNVLPIIPTLRYNLHAGESLTAFFYAGVVINRVFGTVGSDQAQQTVNTLAGVLPAAGAGMLFRIGPAWDVRVDVGIDSFTAGVVLGF